VAIATGVPLVRDYERRLWILAYACEVAYNFSTIPSLISIDWFPFWPIQILLGFRKENAETHGIWFPIQQIRTS
jgi:hypothetical protein